MQDRSAVVIVAAGVSRRMRGRDKLWTSLSGRITLARTIDAFENSPLITTIILVINAERRTDVTALCKHEGWRKIAAIVPGGARRQDSVRAGLDMLFNIDPACRWVMIHDGARPFVNATILEAGMKAVKEHLAVTAAVPVKDTVKQAQEGQIVATLERSQLWSTQTPQIFSFPLLHQAHHHSLAQENVSDDATLLTRLGQHVTIFPGSYTNIKITTQEDLLLAEALLQGLLV